MPIEYMVYQALLWKLTNTHMNFRRTYHPHIDSQTKAVNHFLKNHIRDLVGNNMKTWDQKL